MSMDFVCRELVTHGNARNLVAYSANRRIAESFKRKPLSMH